jgi:hypothetical protein
MRPGVKNGPRSVNDIGNQIASQIVNQTFSQFT